MPNHITHFSHPSQGIAAAAASAAASPRAVRVTREGSTGGTEGVAGGPAFLDTERMRQVATLEQRFWSQIHSPGTVGVDWTGFLAVFCWKRFGFDELWQGLVIHTVLERKRALPTPFSTCCVKFCGFQSTAMCVVEAIGAVNDSQQWSGVDWQHTSTP